jgi:hypothetical protein
MKPQDGRMPPMTTPAIIVNAGFLFGLSVSSLLLLVI